MKLWMHVLCAASLALAACSSDSGEGSSTATDSTGGSTATDGTTSTDGMDGTDGTEATDGGEGFGEQDEEVCLHSQNGPYETVAAGNGPATATDATKAHTWITVTLNGEGSEKTGTVQLTADEAGDMLLYLGAQVPMAVTTADGAAVAFEATEVITMCAEVDSRYVFEAEVGTYLITFGPTDADSVGFAFEEGGAHEGHSDEADHTDHSDEADHTDHADETDGVDHADHADEADHSDGMDHADETDHADHGHE